MPRPDKRVIESYLNRFLQVTQKINIDVLQAEVQILEQIEKRSQYSSYVIGTVGAITIFYLLSNTPYISQINKIVNDAIEKVVFSETLQAAGLVKKAGWWSLLGYKDQIHPAVNLASRTLQFLNNKFISRSGMTSLFFTQITSKKAQNYFSNYFKNNYTSNWQFITLFDKIDFDTQNEIAKIFILNQLKKKLDNAFDPSFKNCKLSDIKLIGKTLKDLQEALNQELKFVHNQMNDLDNNEILENYKCFFRIAELTTDDSIPHEYICPITLDLMSDPVSLGVHTFERKAIEEWIIKNGANPMNRQAVSIHDLVPNIDLKNKIQEFRQEQELKQQQIHENIEAFQFS